MMRRILSLLAVCALIVSAANAGGKDLRNAKRTKLIIDDGVEHFAQPGRGSYVPGLDNATSLTWVAVDSMVNALGPANSEIEPMAYDPPTNVLAVIHRGASPYATGGGGQLWYNISRNSGLTWRRVGELNGGAPATCRYPSCAISNPAGTADTGQCLFVYSAPNTSNGGVFGEITYGVDFPLGGGAASGVVDPGNNVYASATTIWTQPSSPWVIWATFDLGTGLPNNFTNWRTEDYITVIRTTPASWRDTLPNFINALSHIVGKATTAGSYLGTLGFFGGDDSAIAVNAGYTKSTDNGATWGPWTRPRPDWVQPTGLPTNLDMYDYHQADGPGLTIDYKSDMVVDVNNRVHFFHVVCDSPWTQFVPRHIVEIYETGTGWAYKWVQQSLNPYAGLGYPGLPPTGYLDQTGNAMHASLSSDGQLMTLVWLDAATMAPADTFPDIWFSYRKINGNEWSTPVNLTETPGFPELLLHAAPTVKINSPNNYTLFLGRSYQCNINTYPPDNNVKTTFYASSYTFTITGVNETGQQPLAFRLEQNYPNPFNPSTTIRYSVAQAGHVALRVFNTLGQEVAMLVDENQSVGEHQAKLDASKFSSGVYIYKITAGSWTESRKMVLLK